MLNKSRPSIILINNEDVCVCVCVLQVRFEAAVGEDTNEARYVLQFQRSQLVVFKNIEFVGSFGIVGAELISVLAIEDCSFR